MATAQKKKAEEAPELPEEAATPEPPIIHSVKDDDSEPPKAYVQIDAEDYEEFLWWRASESVINALRDKTEGERVVSWSEYWVETPDAEKPFFAEVLFRFSEDVLKLYIENSQTDKARFLRNYAGLLLVDYYEKRYTGK